MFKHFSLQDLRRASQRAEPILSLHHIRYQSTIRFHWWSIRHGLSYIQQVRHCYHSYTTSYHGNLVTLSSLSSSSLVCAFLESWILRVHCYDTEHYEVRFYHFNLSSASALIKFIKNNINSYINLLKIWLYLFISYPHFIAETRELMNLKTKNGLKKRYTLYWESKLGNKHP